MDLLTGDRFYSSSDAALREAILNSIDACGRREAEESGFHPSIGLTFDESSHSVTITDNGDGMDRHDVSALFAKIGASAARALQETKRGSYQAIGEFGIGVVSYFLVCEQFEVHTIGDSGEPIGLVFSKAMFDMSQTAEATSCKLKDRGTTVILHILDNPRFDLLVAKYPYWVRDVPHLTASTSARGALEQGGRRHHITPIATSNPDWVEKAELGPPAEITYWTRLDGNAHVDVLYRGVFVQELNVPHLWGIEGSLHVNPKRFKPTLNREAFIAEGFETEMQTFLRRIHPAILETALLNMRAALVAGEQDGWGLSKWITIWLAIPRGGSYERVSQLWDEEFRSMKAFRRLTEAADAKVSLSEIESSGANPVFVVPNPLDRASPEGRKAISVLRARGAYIVQGLQREGGYLSNASFTAPTTAELLLSQFRGRLPQLISIEEVARDFIREEETLADIFPTSPKVQLVRLGEDAAPIARIGESLWINAESPQGRAIVLNICKRNEGYLGLLVAVQQHAPDHSPDVVRHIQSATELGLRLGPVRRQFLRSLVK